MRLIDADALKKKLKKYDPMLSTLSSFEFVTKEDIDEIPTVCDIEQYKNFAKWVASEIMPEIEWLNNQNAFPELACRRLEKLGIVKADGNDWVLV